VAHASAVKNWAFDRLSIIVDRLNLLQLAIVYATTRESGRNGHAAQDVRISHRNAVIKRAKK
jgi:hypothetical protein